MSEKTKNGPRFLWGYAIGVTVTLALVSPWVFGANSIENPFSFIQNMIDGRPDEALIKYDYSTFGQVKVSAKQSVFTAEFERYINDNPASFERMARYPVSFQWRDYEKSVGLLELAFKDEKTGDKAVYPCTASIISTKYILTARHCVFPGDYDSSKKSEKVFKGYFHLGYLGETDEQILHFPVVDPGAPIEGADWNGQLDYAVLEVDFHTRLEGEIDPKAGILPRPVFYNDLPDIKPVRLTHYAPDKEEPLFIIHHPLKRPLVITTHSCLTVNERPAVLKEPHWNDVADHKLEHLCDTLPGSSGAPIFSMDRNAVVAIHTGARNRKEANEDYPNEGTYIRSIAQYSANRAAEMAASESRSAYGILAALTTPKPFTADQARRLEHYTGQSQRAFDNEEYGLAMALALDAIPQEEAQAEDLPQEARDAERALLQAYLSDHLLLGLYPGHTGFITDIAITSDSKKLLTAGGDAKVKLWDIASGELLNTYPETDIVNSVMFSSGGDAFLTAVADGTAKLWSLNNYKKPEIIFPHKGAVTSAVFSKKDERILTASRDGAARIWDVRDNHNPIQLFGEPDMDQAEYYTKGISKAVFADDDKKILTSGWDGAARLWDVATGSQEDEFIYENEMGPFGNDSPISQLEISPDGSWFLTASTDGVVRVWIWGQKRPQRTFEHPGQVLDVAIANSGTEFLTVGEGGLIRLWNINQPGNSPLSSIQDKSIPLQSKIAFLEGNNRFISTGGENGIARLWSLYDWEPATFEQFQMPDDLLLSASFSKDGNKILIAGNAVSIRTLSGEELWSLDEFDDPVWTAIFSPNNKQVLTASVSGVAELWDIDSKERNAKFENNYEGSLLPIFSVAFSRHGSRILTAGDRGVMRVWDRTGGDPLITFEDPYERKLNSVMFSFDESKILTAGCAPSAELWIPDVSNQPIIHYAEEFHVVGDCFNSATFSSFPAGENKILVASDDGTAKLWNLNGGDPAMTFGVASSLFNAKPKMIRAKFSPDENLVLAAARDGTVIIWDAHSGHSLWEFQGRHCELTDSDYCVLMNSEFSPDGAKIMTAFSDGFVEIFDAPPAGAALRKVAAERLMKTGRLSITGDFIYSKRACRRYDIPCKDIP